jgi:cardiolipin synthase
MSAVEAHSRGSRTRHSRGRRKGSAAGLSADLTSRWKRVREKFTWWEISLFVMGVLALCFTLSTLFFAVGDKPARIYTDAPVPPVSSLEFSIALSNLVGAPADRGGSVTVLNNGDEFIPELLRAIQGATRTINFSVYIWKDGDFSDKVLSALLKKQQEGVKVRVLLDGFGAAGISDRKFAPLVSAGGRVEKFRTPKFGQLTRFHRRNHRRAIVIDGEVGFTGGMAVSDIWEGHAQDPDHWRDMMFRVTGPMARRLQAGFVDMWASSSGEILVGPDTYPDPSTDSAGVERFISLANSPADDEQSMAYFFLVPIMAAQHSVYLASPYFIPDAHMLRVLEEKARAGVDVRLLLPGHHTDNLITRASSQARYDALLQAGVKIYEYRPTFIHAKFAVIDGVWSIVGSPNLNSRSRQLDQEVAFGILDRGLGSRLHSTYLNELQQSDAITLDAWRKRNPLNRALETFARVLDQQS